MNYRTEFTDITKTFNEMKWGDSVKFPISEPFYDAIPQQLADCMGVVYKHVPEIGHFIDREPDYEHFLIFVLHKHYPFYYQALESIKPFWRHTIFVDQGETPKEAIGDYARFHVTSTYSFTELKNWLMLFCRKKNISNMFYMHDDGVLGRITLPGKMLSVAEQTDASVVLSNYDIFSLWRTDRVFFYDERIPFYYGDIDLWRRLRIFDYSKCTFIDHDVRHVLNGTTKYGSNDFQNAQQKETDEAREFYIKKWGGNMHEEKYLIPWNMEQ